jgi:hypothetical protein
LAIVGAVLPTFCFLIMAVILYARQEEDQTWHGAVLGSIVGLGAFVAVSSELLSPLNYLSRSGVTIAWLCLTALLVAYGTKTSLISKGFRRWKRALGDLRAWPRAYLALLASCVFGGALLFALAIFSPPNTTDSLVSHLARVAHWAQDGTLAHYAAFQHQQLWTPIWSQTAMLHLMQLIGTDQGVNLVQWSSMVVSAIAVAGIAKGLGASRPGQWLAVTMAVSAPMVLLQSTSTQNDLAVGVWIVITVFYVQQLVHRDLYRSEWFALGGAVGLGMLTKVTYYPYIGLVLVGAAGLAWRNRGEASRLLVKLLLVATIAGLLNLGFWLRNVRTYGSPIGHQETVSAQAQMSLNLSGLVSRVVQHAALHFPTPSESINELLIQGVRSVSRFVGSPNDGFSVIWSWNHEDLAGSPIHFTLIVIGIIVALLGGPRKKPDLFWYALAVLVGFMSLAWSIQSGVFRARYHVSFLLLGAPLVATVADRYLGRRVVLGLAWGFLVLALPWVLFNQTRPAIGWRPRTRTESVFQVSRSDLLFSNPYELKEPYILATSKVLEEDCRVVGLSLDSHDPEYAIWWLLGAPSSGIDIQAVRPLSSLEYLRNPSFEPCAVLCTNCGDRQMFGGLPMLAAFDHVRVYQQGGR